MHGGHNAAHGAAWSAAAPPRAGGIIKCCTWAHTLIILSEWSSVCVCVLDSLFACLLVGANLFVAALHPKCMQRLIDQRHDPNLPLSLSLTHLAREKIWGHRLSIFWVGYKKKMSVRHEKRALWKCMNISRWPVCERVEILCSPLNMCARQNAYLQLRRGLIHSLTRSLARVQQLRADCCTAPQQSLFSPQSARPPLFDLTNLGQSCP
jgi:hypothetical protein